MAKIITQRNRYIICGMERYISYTVRCYNYSSIVLLQWLKHKTATIIYTYCFHPFDSFSFLNNQLFGTFRVKYFCTFFSCTRIDLRIFKNVIKGSWFARLGAERTCFLIIFSDFNHVFYELPERLQDFAISREIALNLSIGGNWVRVAHPPHSEHRRSTHTELSEVPWKKNTLKAIVIIL